VRQLAELVRSKKDLHQWRYGNVHARLNVMTHAEVRDHLTEKRALAQAKRIRPARLRQGSIGGRCTRFALGSQACWR